MTTAVIDSSVAVTWFVPEVLSEEAAHLLDGSWELLAPDLLFPECGNTLWKKVARDELAVEEARAVLAALGQVPLVITPSSKLVDAAFEIALAHQRSVYDSLYVALAVARECALITADDRLVNALGRGPLAEHVRPLSGLRQARPRP